MLDDQTVRGGIAAKLKQLPEKLRVCARRVNLLHEGQQCLAVPPKLDQAVLPGRSQPCAGRLARIRKTGQQRSDLDTRPAGDKR
jgi:hypothetical protein